LRLEWIEAGSLKANPANWRRHGEAQISALKATMAEVGWAGALLYNERTGRLIDGHARKDSVEPETAVPVLVGNWTHGQERRILASLDPLTGMAEADEQALAELLEQVDLSGPELGGLAEALAEMAPGTAELQKPASRRARAAGPRRRGERTASFVVGHLKFEVPRTAFDRWLGGLEAKVGSNPDRLIAQIKRLLRL